MLNKYAFLEKMEKAGLTQETLAKKARKSVNTVNSHINGKTKPNIVEALVYCDILDITDANEKAYIFLYNPSQYREEIL